MWQSFVLLFTEMSTLVAIFFIVGVLFCLIELFVPGFGIFGIGGIGLIIAAIILRMAQGGDVFMFVYMTIFAVLIVGGMFLLISHSARKGKLSKTKIFDVGTSVPTGITEGTKDFTYLLGHIGKTLTFLRPIGTADFDGKIVDVIAKTGSIESGVEIKVVSVEGQRVVVEETKN